MEDIVIFFVLATITFLFLFIFLVDFLFIIAKNFAKMVKNQENFHVELLESLERLERLKEIELLDNHNIKQWEEVAKHEKEMRKGK